MSDKYLPPKSNNANKNPKSPTVVAAIATIAAACITGIAAIIAALIGAVHFTAPGGTTPAKSVTVTAHSTVPVRVTKTAASRSGRSTVNSANLKSILLSAQMVDPELSAVPNTPPITEICNAVAPSGAHAIATETLEDPQVTRIFTETIIDQSNAADAASSIKTDSAAVENDCAGQFDQYSQQFSGYVSGAAPYQCGTGPELTATLTASNPSSLIAYAGTFIAEQCNNFTVSIEDMNNAGKLISDEGFLNEAAGRSPIIKSGG